MVTDGRATLANYKENLVVDRETEADTTYRMAPVRMQYMRADGTMAYSTIYKQCLQEKASDMNYKRPNEVEKTSNDKEEDLLQDDYGALAIRLR